MTSRPSFASTLSWSYVMDGGRQAITSCITLVLAALLGPEVFGVVAMALVYVLFIELLLKQGMGAAVIQRRDLSAAHLDSAFWLVMGTALVLTLASAAMSGWWATVNRTPELQAVILGLTPLIPLQGLIVVQEALLRRELRFRSLALRANLSALVGGAIGVALALAGFGVWALVAQQLGTVLVAVLVLWAVSDWRPRMRFSSRAARELLGFSSGSLVASLGVFVNNKADALLIGLLFGPVAVGLYRLAARLIDTVVGITVQALQSVSLPELSRVQDDPARFRGRVLRLMSVGALMGAPALGVLAGSAEAVLGVVGEAWLPAASALRLLCLAGVIRVMFVFTGPMLQALGRPHQQAVLSWLVAGLSAGGFLVAGLLVTGHPIANQLTGLALSRAMLYGLVFAVICVALVWRLARITPGDIVTAVGPVVGAGVVAAVVGQMAWTTVESSGMSPWAGLMATAVPALASAGAVLFTTDRTVRAYVRTAFTFARRPLSSARHPDDEAEQAGDRRDAPRAIAGRGATRMRTDLQKPLEGDEARGR